MHTQINTLINLNSAALDLDMVQDWINSARVACRRNPEVQAELDRQQHILDSKRAALEVTMLRISSCN